MSKIGLAEYCDERVCLSVYACLSAIISLELHVRSSPNFCASYLWPWRGILLWRRSDMLCISGFMDDVIFAHKPRLLDVAAQLAINCSQ